MYKRGEPWPLEVFPYEQILSFGAPLPNAYKIAVEGRELVFETQMVCKIKQMLLRNSLFLDVELCEFLTTLSYMSTVKAQVCRRALHKFANLSKHPHTLTHMLARVSLKNKSSDIEKSM